MQSRQQPRKGLIALFIGALCFSLNGIVSKLVLETGLSAWRLAEIRSSGAFVSFLIYLLLFKRQALKLSIKAIPEMLIYGIVGYAGVQAFYFVAIVKMPVSVGLIIEFTAPIWITIWIKFVRKNPVPKIMWLAVLLAFGGLILISQIWQGLKFDTVGLIAAFLDAFALTAYFLLGEKWSSRASTETLMLYGFGISMLFWWVTFPLWSYPIDIFNKQIDLKGEFAGTKASGWILILFVIVVGTLIPYTCNSVSYTHLTLPTKA